MKHESIWLDGASQAQIPLDVKRIVEKSFFPGCFEGAFTAFMQATEDHVHVVDVDGVIVRANGPSSGCGSRTISALGGLLWKDLWPLERQSDAIAALRTAFDHGTACLISDFLTDDGKKINIDVALTRVETGGTVSPLVIAIGRKAAFAGPVDVRRLGNVDALTALPNAMQFHRELSSRTADGNAGRKPFMLAIIDLDGFKQWNSRLGPQAYDALLARFAALLKNELGDECFLSRSSGDEFALIIEGASQHGNSVSQVERMIRSCTEHLSSGGDPVEFSASAGISHYPADATSDQELLRNAHAALRAAKGAGRGKCVNFDGNLRQQMQRHSSMLELARAGIAGDWIKPYYQPKVDMVSGKVVGLEALLRWQNDDGIIHLPASISAAFEDLELATRISGIMLQKVIADVKRWRAIGSTLPVAINVSNADFRNRNFSKEFLEQVGYANLPTSAFELEVTEGVFLGIGTENVDATLKQLNAAGVRIALDDFGTGFASLTHLKQYPVDVIKIDRSFISDLVASPDDRAIVSAMIKLGKHLAIEVVAEGVETAFQAALLRDLGCHIGQGFYFAHAVPADDVPTIARRHDINAPAPVTRFSFQGR